MKALILHIFFLFLAASGANAADFVVTAPSSWKIQRSSFPGEIYRHIDSKQDEVILVSRRKNDGRMIFAEMDRNSDILAKARQNFLNQFGLTRYSLNSLGKVSIPHAQGIDVVVLESSYVGLSGAITQMIERQYYAGDSIYSVVYSAVTPILGDRAGIHRVMDQFRPDLSNVRIPASETVKGDRGSSKMGLRSSLEEGDSSESFQKREAAKAAVCDHLDPSIRKSDSDPKTFTYDGMKSWGGGCWEGVKESLPALADSLAKTGAFIGGAVVGAAKGAWYYATNPMQLARDAYAAPAVAIEAVRNADLSVSRAFTNIAGAISTSVTDFACLKTDLQMKAICKFVAMTGEGAVLGSVAFRAATLTGEALMKVTSNATRAVRDVIDATKVASKIEATAPEVLAAPKVPVAVEAVAPKAPVLTAMEAENLELVTKTSQLFAKLDDKLLKANFDFLSSKFKNNPEAMRTLNQLMLESNGEMASVIARLFSSFNTPASTVDKILTEAAQKKTPIKDVMAQLRAMFQEGKLKYLDKISKTSVTDNDLVRVADVLEPKLRGSMQTMLSKGGNAFREDMTLMAREGRFSEVMKYAEAYKDGGPSSINDLRSKAETFRSELSTAKAAGKTGRKRKSLQDIQAIRDAELSNYNGLQTFRQTAEDVVAVRKKFPLLNTSIDDFTDALRGTELLPKIKTPDEIPKLNSKSKSRMKDVDPRVQRTLVDVWNRMNDGEALAKYAKSLAEDAAVEMMKSGTKREVDALTRGELTRTAVMKVLVKRHRAQGNDKFATITGFERTQLSKPSSATRKSGSNQDFRDAVGQGPFFDKPFNGNRHGIDTHFLQIDYVSDVVWNATEKNPRLFWDHLGAKKGINDWVPLFDANGKTLASPEYFAHQVSKLLKITD